MGAISGLVYAGGREVSRDETDRLTHASAASAIDGVMVWRGGPAGLVRFRHATTPEAVAERQPRPSDASGVVMCFDGRLDHRDSLIARLERAGEALRHRPDDELATALFEAEGDAFLQRLAGDWALALWQPGQRRLLCARSAAGFRSFYYVADATRFAFATAPRGLILGLGLERRINEAAVAEHLTQQVVTPDESLWHNIARLPQGSAIAFQHGQVRRWQWDDAPHDDWSRVSEAEHVDRFNALFDDALVAATRSDTPVLAQLSGGLDSSSVVCRADELHRAGRIARPLATVTTRFPGDASDEGRWSALVDAQCGTPSAHIERYDFDLAGSAAWVASSLHMPLRPNTQAAILPTLAHAQDLGARVLLTGEGGDEWLGGTHTHWMDELRRGRIDLILREAFAQENLKPGAALRGVLHGAVAPFVRPALRAAVTRRRYDIDHPYPDWANAAWLRGLDLAGRIAASPQPVKPSTFAARNRYALVEARGVDLHMDALTAYGDEHGIAFRHPFYDRRLIGFYLGASGAVLFRGGVRKHLLREAMRGTLPEPIRLRRDKAAFNTLAITGLEACFAVTPLTEMLPVTLGWVDAARLGAIWETYRAWRAAGASLPVPNLPFGALWNVASLDLWLRHAVRL